MSGFAVLGSRRLARSAIGTLAATLGAAGLVVASGEQAIAAPTCVAIPGSGGQQQCTFTDTSAPQEWVVPDGITKLHTVYLRGGDGGDGAGPNGAGSGGTGGVGGEVNATDLPVAAGQTITFFIGSVGGPGAGCANRPAGVGGAGGRSGDVVPSGGNGGAGGDGGNGGSFTSPRCAGGGGGGGTFMMLGTDIPGAADPMLAAGGGGGGGGASTSASGAAAAAGGVGGGDSAGGNGQTGDWGGQSGNEGGAAGTGDGPDSTASNETNGGNGSEAAASYEAGGGGGGGYCGGGGGSSDDAGPHGGGGGGGEGLDQGDPTSSNPCDVLTTYLPASVPGQPGSTERTERAQGILPGRAIITFGGTPRGGNNPGGGGGFEQPPLPRQGPNTAPRKGKPGKAQCNNDPGRDPSKDPRTRKCQKKRRGGAMDLTELQGDRRWFTL